MNCARRLSWSSVCAEVGLMGLDTTDPVQFSTLRDVISTLRWNGMEFNSFPKELVDPDYDVTILLRGPLLTSDPATLAADLCTRNFGLYGTLRVISSHLYADSDLTKEGKPMKGWKLIRLVADDLFMDALQHYHVKYCFTLGCKHARIRGGRSERVVEPDPVSRSRSLKRSTSSLSLIHI